MYRTNQNIVYLFPVALSFQSEVLVWLEIISSKMEKNEF